MKKKQERERKIYHLSPIEVDRLYSASLEAAGRHFVMLPKAPHVIEEFAAREYVVLIWKNLGAKYGFDWETVEDSGRGTEYISAVPL